MPTIIQSVTRALQILDTLAEKPDGLSVKDIAGRLGLNVSTTHHLVNTLQHRRYLVRLENGSHRLGPAVSRLYGALIRTAPSDARLSAIGLALARETNETTYVCVWQDGEVVIRDIVEGSQALRVGGLQVGFAADAHSRASGKVLLAHLDEAELDLYLADRPLRPRTRHTMTSKKELRAHLNQVAEQGFALDQQEFAEGVCCVAAPVFAADSQAVAAISVSVPAQRFVENKQAIIRSVTRAAHEASSALGHRASPEARPAGVRRASAASRR